MRVTGEVLVLPMWEEERLMSPVCEQERLY